MVRDSNPVQSVCMCGMGPEFGMPMPPEFVIPLPPEFGIPMPLEFMIPSPLEFHKMKLLLLNKSVTYVYMPLINKQTNRHFEN